MPKMLTEMESVPLKTLGCSPPSTITTSCLPFCCHWISHICFFDVLVQECSGRRMLGIHWRSLQGRDTPGTRTLKFRVALNPIWSHWVKRGEVRAAALVTFCNSGYCDWRYIASLERRGSQNGRESNIYILHILVLLTFL